MECNPSPVGRRRRKLKYWEENGDSKRGPQELICVKCVGPNRWRGPLDAVVPERVRRDCQSIHQSFSFFLSLTQLCNNNRRRRRRRGNCLLSGVPFFGSVGAAFNPINVCATFFFFPSFLSRVVEIELGKVRLVTNSLNSSRAASILFSFGRWFNWVHKLLIISYSPPPQAAAILPLLITINKIMFWSS